MKREIKAELRTRIDGHDWKFVVYEDDTFTLLDPDGMNVPPMDKLGPDKIDSLLEKARSR